jgi:hypothetical protein
VNMGESRFQRSPSPSTASSSFFIFFWYSDGHLTISFR